MRFTRNLMIFFGLLLVAAWVDDFHQMLESNHWQRQPLTEINVTYREPMSVEIMLIDTHCPHKRGALGEFLACREAIKQKMLRSDI